MNNLDKVFKEKKNILSVYFTAGFPSLNDTIPIMKHLQEAGADIIEVGMPFSDPVADGPTIQKSNQKALENGMSVPLLLEQLKEVRKSIHIPIILMGYLNPVMQYGVEKFCKACQTIGIDGLILPDLPLREYKNDYKSLFEAAGIYNIFLITPQTTSERIKMIDDHSSGFIYMVSSASITGSSSGMGEEQLSYFERINAMELNHPFLIGFGISDKASFATACQYASGAIIGSAFIKALENSHHLESSIKYFVQNIKGNR